MRVAVLSSEESWHYRDLARAAAGRHEIRSLPFSRMASLVGQGGVEVESRETALTGFDAVIVRTMPPGSLEQVVFRMDALARLEAAGMLVVNPPKCLETAIDKYLTTARLAEAGLPTPETYACQTSEEALAAFVRLGGDVVIKPLFGSEGRGIVRADDENLAWRAVRLIERLGGVIYLQRFIEHEGFDLRLFVLGDEVLAMRRSSAHDWRTNVSRGGTGEPCEATEHERELAIRAARAVGAYAAGVDVLTGRDGAQYVIEVNAVPGWKALSRALDLDIAARLLDYVERRLKG